VGAVKDFYYISYEEFEEMEERALIDYINKLKRENENEKSKSKNR